MSQKAQRIVDALLETGPLRPSPRGRLIRLKTPQGEIQADWNGYYDLRPLRPLQHSVGYPDGQGGWTHGTLHAGDEILDQVPSFDEWAAERERSKKQNAA